jgi:hypothetical protein
MNIDDLYEQLPESILAAIEGDPVARAMYIARVVRDAMEDFHIEHLTDGQMAQLNPIIRQAITDALVVLNAATDPGDPRSLSAIADMTFHMPPNYWEPPDPEKAIERLDGTGKTLTAWGGARPRVTRRANPREKAGC